MYQPKELYTPVKKKAPFNTGSKLIEINTDPYLPKNKNNKDNCDDYLVGHVNLPGQLIDAETNEPLELSRATWNVREGRINLNAKTILDMGTGKLDIKNRVLNDNISRYNNINSSCISKDVIGSRSNGIGSSSGSVGADASTYNIDMIRSDVNRYSNRDDNNDTRHKNINGTSIDRVVYNEIDTDHHDHQNGALPTRNQLPPIVLTSSSSSVRYSTSQQLQSNLSQQQQQQSSSPSSSSTSSSLLVPISQHQVSPVVVKRHELITKLLKEGPLTPMFHVHWDCRTNDIVRQPGYRYEDDDDSLYQNDDEHDDGYVFYSNNVDVATAAAADDLDDENKILSQAISSIKHDHLPPRPDSQQDTHFLPSIPSSSLPPLSSALSSPSPTQMIPSFSLPVATSMVAFNNNVNHISTPPSRQSSAFKSANSTTTTTSASATFTSDSITGAAAAAVALRTSTPSSRISTAASKIISNLIPHNIDVTNIENWHNIEEKVFQEIYAIGYQIEKNKINTKVMKLKLL